MNQFYEKVMKKFLSAAITLFASLIFTFPQAAAQDSTAYVKASWQGLDFEMPEGLVENREKGYIAKSPDGSFGVSLSQADSRSINQKRAASLCQGLARQMHIARPEVKLVKINGMKGAIATGDLENKRVSILILASGGNQIEAVVINDPSRSAWADHFFRTFSR